MKNFSKQGVPLVYEDFESHRGEKVNPIKSTYRDYEVHELPPNNKGVTTLELLKLIEITNLNNREFNDEEMIITFFNLALIAYKDRDIHVADPCFYEYVPLQLIDNMP